MLAIGKNLPALRGQTAEGELALSDFKGHWLVVYFYPKDATPGCTSEATDFRDLHAQFAAKNARIVGVSRDSVGSHARFAAKQALPFPLVADVDERWCQAFDVIHEKKLYGRPYVGVVRSSFLIDPAGKLAQAWRAVKVPGHAQAVLDAIPAA